MRKFFILCLITFVMCVNAIAQNGKWEYHYNKADELLGTENHYANIFTDTNGNYFVCWSNDFSIKIGTNKGIFDYYDNEVVARIGFYENGKLIEKEIVYLYVPNGDSDTAFIKSDYESKLLGEKIILHLKTKGSVRIVINKYSGADCDITIPMNKGIKFNGLSKKNEYLLEISKCTYETTRKEQEELDSLSKVIAEEYKKIHKMDSIGLNMLMEVVKKSADKL